MQSEIEPVRALSSRNGSAGIGRALEAWLPRRPAGADAVRAELARRLAAQLDDPTMPAYVLARVTSELRGILNDLEGALDADGDVDASAARRILRDLGGS